jgi:hypothetical protein
MPPIENMLVILQLLIPADIGNGFSIFCPQIDSFSIYARSAVFIPSSLRSLRFKKGLLKNRPIPDF